MFKTYVISSLLALAAFSHVQYQGYSLFGSSAADQQSAARAGSGARSTLSHK